MTKVCVCLFTLNRYLHPSTSGQSTKVPMLFTHPRQKVIMNWFVECVTRILETTRRAHGRGGGGAKTQQHKSTTGPATDQNDVTAHRRKEAATQPNARCDAPSTPGHFSHPVAASRPLTGQHLVERQKILLPRRSRAVTTNTNNRIKLFESHGDANSFSRSPFFQNQRIPSTSPLHVSGSELLPADTWA